MKRKNLIYDGMYGLAVADALGVPYETATLDEMQTNPCTDMIGFGYHNQPAGTWSDDTSMSLCVADSFGNGFDTEKMMKNFADWKKFGHYTAGGRVFDIGNTCRIAINDYINGTPIEYCGNNTIDGNGNGALMRTFPVALYQVLKRQFKDDELGAFLEPIHQASMLTHAHEIGLICCGLFSLTIRELILSEGSGDTLMDIACCAYEKGMKAYDGMNEFSQYLNLFTSPKELVSLSETDLPSWGYALNTWNIALWSLLTTDNYRDCVLKAVNVGGDTDTNAAVAGALAGVAYGRAAIPEEWMSALLNKQLIDEVCEKFNSCFFEKEVEVIDSFEGKFSFLLMKTPAKINLEGRTFENAAAAYYAVSVPEEYRDKFIGLNARAARKLFNSMPQLEISEKLIFERLCMVLTALYEQNDDLRKKLLSTNQIPISYDTTGGHDNVLGSCRCKDCRGKDHQNLYGKALMQVRSQLKQISD